MKKTIKSLSALLLFLSINVVLQAQDFKKPGEYLDYISAEYTKIAKEEWDYTRAIGHGKRARLIDKRRNEVAQTIQESKRAIGKMPAINKMIR